MWASSFIFDGIPCEAYGLIIAGLNGNVNDEGDGGSKLEYQKSNMPINKRWKKNGNSVYKEPLTFTIQVCKQMCGSTDHFIDAQEQSAIARWLIRQDGYKKLQFCQDDLEHIYFNAMVTSIKTYNVGKTYGLEISFETDAPWGYMESTGVKELTITTAPFSHSFEDMSDEIGYIYPNMNIEILESGNLEIYNSIEDRTFKIKNCIAGEIITVNGDSLTIKSSVNSHKLYDDFNYKFFRIANTNITRTNEITYSLPCKVTWEYDPIVKVGV